LRGFFIEFPEAGICPEDGAYQGLHVLSGGDRADELTVLQTDDRGGRQMVRRLEAGESVVLLGIGMREIKEKNKDKDGKNEYLSFHASSKQALLRWLPQGLTWYGNNQDIAHLRDLLGRSAGPVRSVAGCPDTADCTADVA